MLSSRAWNPAPGTPVYPETALLAGRPSTGLAFSGGGSRAMVAGLSQLAALHQLGLLEHVTYITGISGGSWATLVYSFAQLGAPGVAANDTELL
eukprot:595345-Prymnesium_polylepis.1